MKLRRLIQLGQRALPPARGGVVVLAYHLVGAGTRAPVDLPLEEFQRQLDHLSAKFEVVGLARALAELEHVGERPRAVLTFDDAYSNFATVVWPMLRERKLPSVLYVPTGFISGTTRSPIAGTDLPACSWSDLRDLVAAGLEIGSHGEVHVDLRRLDSESLERDLLHSRGTLQRELGVDPTSFCYVQGKHDSRVVAAVKRHYKNAVTGGGRRLHGGDLHRIPRFPVRRDDTDFAGMLRSRLWLTEAMGHVARQLRS